MMNNLIIKNTWNTVIYLNEISKISLTSENMKSDKSPGSDGFTSEFLRCFWPTI